MECTLQNNLCICINLKAKDMITTVQFKTLDDLYKFYNEAIFEGNLAECIVNMSRHGGAYGFFAANRWRSGQGDKQIVHEISINPDYMNRTDKEWHSTLVHEMCHLYCRENNIKEVSRGGKYHNKRFKEVAEAHGLTCVPCGQYGWNTTPGDNLVEYALNKGWNEILLGRNTLPPAMRTGATGTAQPGAATPGGKRPSSTRKVVCPVCGQSVRATKKVNIICGVCMVPMIEAE